MYIINFSPPDHPQIFDMHCPTTIVEGSNVTLHCNVTGNPLPNIVWIWRYTGSVLGRSEKLTLTDVNRSQTGTYLCRAWNGIGSNSTRTCGLDVYCEQNVYPFSLLHETVETISLFFRFLSVDQKWLTITSMIIFLFDEYQYAMCDGVKTK